MIDLHLHSNCSDGSDSPSELVDKAEALNLKAIALTDHDTVDGLDEFLSAGESKQIIAIPGIELSIKHEPYREINDVHIVGLNIDHRCNPLVNTLKLQMEGRLHQKEAICNRLRNEFDYNITYEEVKAIAKSNSVGRPHIVEVMIKNNSEKVKNKTKDQLFKMISLGGIAYVDREFEVTLEQAIEVIKKAKGIPILAHPGVYEVSDREQFVKMCTDAGIEGIEIEYPYDMNRPYYETVKEEWARTHLPDFYRKLAEKYRLIKSGGSDYHGGKKNIKLGQANVPDEYLLDIISF
ncbi:MAG: DNA polymerase III PolC-type [Promethearchaeota archaeon]|nr:MAG: DNA polymerase III PolC-type [Candidatus Lokiarchaeota archaeon]